MSRRTFGATSPLAFAARGLALVAAATLTTATALAFGVAPAAAQTVAITNAKIYPVSGPVIERGTVVMKDGKITAVGADVQAPAGAKVIDGTGKVVTPGFLDSVTQLGIVEIGAVQGTNETRSSNDRITAAYKVSYGINPYSTLIPIARTGGVTRAVVAPSPGTPLIGGQAALIHLTGDRISKMIEKDPVAMFAALDERAAEQTGGGRGDAMLRLREILQDAKDYAANKAAFNAGNRREYSVSRLDLEALIPVLQGREPLALEANHTTDIQNALALRDEFGLKLILVGAADGWMMADDLAKAGVPVVLNPMTDIPTFEELGATLENAGRLQKAGVDVILSSFDAHNVRDLRQDAGNAVAYGMPYDAALRAVTLGPAELWGIADRFGSLEAGKEADVVVWTGDPFELTTWPEHVFVQGQELPNDTRQTKLLERYRTLGDSMPPAYRH